MSTFTVGRQIELRAEVTQLNGLPYEPTMECRVKDPSGATATYAPTEEADGAYQVILIPTLPGLWRYSFEDLTTGEYQDGVFEVVPRPV